MQISFERTVLTAAHIEGALFHILHAAGQGSLCVDVTLFTSIWGCKKQHTFYVYVNNCKISS
jgi:hypothetical protein